MLSTLRKHSRSTIIYVLFAIIIAAFILTFNTMGPTQGCGGAQEVVMADVDGQTVDAGLLRMGDALTIDPPEPGNFSQQALQLQMAYETTRFARVNPDPRMLRFMPGRETLSPLKYRRVMNDLIETFLVSDAAEDMGFRVSDEELADRMYQNPWFRDYWYDEDGKFHKQRFFNFVSYQLGTSPGRYEDFVRREILREKLIAYLSSLVKVSEPEVDYQWRLQNEKVNLRFVEFDPELVERTVKVPEADIQKALTERKDEIATWYDEHKGLFEKEERAKVHGIFIQAPLQSRIDRAEDDAEKAELQKQRAAAKSKAEEVLAKVQAAAAKAADEAAAKKAAAEKAAAEKAAAEAAAAADGADTGAADATAAAEPTTEPTPKADTEPAPASASTVPVAVFEEIAKADSQHLTTKDAGGAFDEWKPRSAFRIWPFAEGVDKAVFALQPGETTGVLEVPNGYWIVRLDGKKPAESTPLAQAREEIARRLVLEDGVKQKTEEMAKQFLALVKEKGGDIGDAAAQWNEQHPVVSDVAGEDSDGQALTVRETGPFALASPVPGGTWGTIPMIGRQQDLAKAAFGLTEDSPVADQVFDVKRGDQTHYFVASLLERVEPDDTNAAEEKQQIRDRLRAEKQVAHYRAWYNAIHEKADIELTSDYQAILTAEETRRQEAMQRKGIPGALPPTAGGGMQ